jgi:hypothetical protein
LDRKLARPDAQRQAFGEEFKREAEQTLLDGRTLVSVGVRLGLVGAGSVARSRT